MYKKHLLIDLFPRLKVSYGLSITVLIELFIKFLMLMMLYV